MTDFARNAGMRALAIGAVVALGISVAACSSPRTAVSAAPTSGSSISSWVAYFEQTGEFQTIGEEQQQVLESAARSGELTWADVTGLIELNFECVEKQGLQAHWQDPLDTYGFPVPNYAITESTALGSDASQAVMDECATRYSSLAEQLYIWQPKNAAIEQDHWERVDRQGIIDCLRDNGVEVDDAATRSEIELLALELATPSGPTNDPVVGVDCFPTD